MKKANKTFVLDHQQSRIARWPVVVDLEIVVPLSNAHRKKLVQLNADLGIESTPETHFLWDSSHLPKKEKASLASSPSARPRGQLELWNRV